MLKSIIVAKTQNNAIGKDNKLLCRMPKDLKHFHDTTMGHHVIMGRKTFESINKPLPGREIIIITKNHDYVVKGCSVAHSIEEALVMAEKAGEKEVFIAGGGEIYRDTLNLTDKIYLTEICAELEGDSFFPKLNMEQWREINRTHHLADERHLYDYDFVELVKV